MKKLSKSIKSMMPVERLLALPVFVNVLKILLQDAARESMLSHQLELVHNFVFIIAFVH